MALPATSVFEIRGGAGADTNGGGFDSAKAGTDYSQQNSAQFTGTDLTSVSSLVVSSASHNFVSTDVGNFINISGGTGFTAGIYEIVSAAANQATLDRSPGTVGVTGTWAVGGAFATIGKALGLAVGGGNIIWVKASATYTVTADLTVGSNQWCLRVTGYTTTRGDNGLASITTSTNSVRAINISSTTSCYGLTFQNLSFKSTAGTRGDGIALTVGSTQFWGVCVRNCIIDGYNIGVNSGANANNASIGGLLILNSVIKNCVSDGVQNGEVNTLISDSFIFSNGGAGFNGVFANGDAHFTFTAINTIFYNNVNGILATYKVSGPNNFILFSLTSCAIYKNTGDGIKFNQSTDTDVPALFMKNTVIYGNGGFGLNLVTSIANTNSTAVSTDYFNAWGSNTSGDTQHFTKDASDLALTADPFTAGTGGDFSLNTTAGGGAVCRNAGFPGVLNAGGTGYQDIGPLRHQDPAAGSPYLGGSSAGMSSIIAM